MVTEPFYNKLDDVVCSVIFIEAIAGDAVEIGRFLK